ncbi:dihydrodipicolinate synthase family protein [Bremerella sp. T1]|uniref:dihydrodipicolinate synthase family protein n=1 Tax=Bremerella sp. TYQ1 TaxID=3119568 RepID=UPI001CCF5452|nr:dihydrodipicolinate synthase family protein [Bremerella volcania]UBM33849.1 dihydrodipicolinate synthase family protein [Bremerella volcania]
MNMDTMKPETLSMDGPEPLPQPTSSGRLQLEGLVAATFAPLSAEGELNLDAIGPMVDALVDANIAGLYVNGSTGEGVSLTGSERRQSAEEFVQAAGGRLPVIVQVGHTSVREAQQLAEHAASVGADAISATPPTYFKPATIGLLLDSLREIMRGAPSLPFYYYHIPRITGVDFDLHQLLTQASEELPQLNGVKYTAQSIHEFQACRAHFADQFDLLYGCDEMLLSGLAAGANGAVGSTYNFAPGLYRRLIEAYRQGENEAAQELQLRSVEMVQAFVRYPALPAQKAIMEMIGLPVGPPRLPWRDLTAEEKRTLESDLKSLGFFDWR